ncbi:leucine efflux protein LeuE [Thauera linaloolentis]|uniref:Leucine export protein LeuE n=1 Tax=Thauera linaloolentis (strain DSM 12138 / JCM 21573 / CCUG 41526 / CIP 105981 / IAM 15112 / NBRC 102519 / 47Lol) TaxID=1123367 RepID=N6Y1E5_THAL4|nr:leucine efflux protein LeuE [Thauera linaloolentis]ENO85355.1 leucine export protein LeuE [Thauera linaloolentis 47Lol = DSM 12138]MCM8567665.1 leucine efflux protein LeuE [Thauera linaloolentis]
MFYGITDLTAFILGTIFIVLLPGPNSLYVMATASRWGVAAGYRGAAGIFVGDTILMLLAVTGMASLLRATPELFMAIKYAGAAYLAWVGVGLLRASLAAWRRGNDAPAEAVPDYPGVGGTPHPFRTALVISLMNPKAILFFVSFFIQFVDPAYAHPALSFVILGVIVQTCSVLYLSVLILAGAKLAAQFRRHRRAAAGATAGVGGVFIGFGAKLATATLG